MATDPSAVILLYHRIFEPSSDPWHVCTSPRHFGEHLDHLRRCYRVIKLRDLVRYLADGRVPEQSVVLTFDDGYADNFWNARPLLERYDLPATIAVTSGYVGSDREFWWDELERLVLREPLSVDRLQVTIKGRRYRWNLGGWVSIPVTGVVLASRWRVFMRGDATPRHKACRELYWLMRPLASGERESVLEMLRAQTAGRSEDRPDYRPLRADEIRQLAEGGLVEIAAHTVTHSTLSMQSPTVQRWEMSQSRQALEDIVGRPVETFCYPFGRQADITSVTVSLARETGFSAACAVMASRVRVGANIFSLPRFPVGSWDGDRFAVRLRTFFDARSAA